MPVNSLSSAHAHARPASIGVRSGGDVVAVQRVADLEAQRVPRAEPAGLDATAQNGVPEGDGILGSAPELAPALARVAGTGDEAADTEDVDVLAERERLDLDAEPLERLGPLNREVGPCIRDILRSRERLVVGSRRWRR